MTSETKNMQARVPAELHTWLKVHTIQEGTTINELVQKLIEDYRNRIEEPSGDYCACADIDCKGDHR